MPPIPIPSRGGFRSALADPPVSADAGEFRLPHRPVRRGSDAGKPWGQFALLSLPNWLAFGAQLKLLLKRGSRTIDTAAVASNGALPLPQSSQIRLEIGDQPWSPPRGL